MSRIFEGILMKAIVSERYGPPENLRTCPRREIK